MKNTKINLEKKFKKDASGWISLSIDYKKIIAHAKTLDELVKKLEEKGNPKGYITRASAGFSSYVG